MVSSVEILQIGQVPPAAHVSQSMCRQKSTGRLPGFVDRTISQLEHFMSEKKTDACSAARWGKTAIVSTFSQTFRRPWRELWTLEAQLRGSDLFDNVKFAV